MRILYITAGAGRMVCGSCLRDGALAAALTRKGHDVLLVPVYTPLRLEGENVAVDRVFYGGINVFLQQKFGLFRHTPRWLDRLLDHPALLRLAARFQGMTAARDLAELTISTLQGEHGRQRKEWRRLLDWLEGQPRPDAVLLSNTMLAALAEPLRRRLGAPVHSLVSGEDLFIDDFPEALREQTLDVLRRRAGECDGLIAANRAYAEHMAGYLSVGRERVHVAPLGIDCRGYPDTPPPAPVDFTVGFLARICPQKGLRHLVEAVGVLNRDSSKAPCRLKVAGYLGAEYRAYLGDVLSDVERWGLRERFEQVGELNRDGKIAFLSGLSCFSVPSVALESKAQFIPEALAAGVPVVLPRHGCFPEWVEATGGGLLCEPGDAASLAAAFGRLRDDPALRERLGAAGRRVVRERFTIEHMADSVLGVLQSNPR
jgi:glycosyltransferase involved in cell wall biosynthesis